MSTRAVIYARFSSSKQSETSIEAQERFCRDYAASHDLQVLTVYKDEAISGKSSRTQKRREYQKMLKDAEKGMFDVILIHQYDRIARSLAEHVTLEQRLQRYGVQLIAVAQDFGGGKEAKIVRALLWSMSEYYIDNLATETRKGLRETALKGLHNGGYAPFGYDVQDQRYVINEIEAHYVRKMFETAAARAGFTGLIKEMKQAGIRGKRGAVIRYPQIYEILRNEKYTGVYLYSVEQEKDRSARRQKENAIRVDDAFPAIIDKELFDEVQTIMNERKQSGRKANYLCSGLVYCQCGAKMHGITTHRKGHKYQYYVCSAKCGAPTAKMDFVDETVINYLRELLSEESQLRIADALRAYKHGENDRQAIFYAARDKRIQDKQNEHDALMKNLSSGVLPASVVQSIAERMDTLQAEIAALRETEPPADFTNDSVKGWLESIKAAPDDEAIHLLVERIDIKAKKEVKVTSTLTSILRNNGCGGRI